VAKLGRQRHATHYCRRTEEVVGFAVAFINHYDQVTRDAGWATKPPTRRLVGVSA
jgi:hypothetical protein